VPAVGTPYMRSLEATAIARCGQRASMLDGLRDYWGGMIRAGATSFWERYDATADGEAHLAMYSRPYGASLCHAWSAGPVFLLSRDLFGLEALAPGWSRFTLRPRSLGLDHAAATIPTPRGPIRITQDASGVTVDIPADTVLEQAGQAIPGPGRCTVATVAANEEPGST